MTSDSPAIQVRDLTKVYPHGVRALDGVTFSAEPGTVFGLVGPNGAGKSTIIKILATLVRPTSGSVRVAGVDVVAEPAAVRRTIGWVSQRSGVDPAATSRENLTLQGRLYGLSGRRLHRHVERLLERFGLGDRADRPARNCSGAMRRRLDVAMGLVHEPDLLFLDEPTAGLDPEMRTELLAEIAGLAALGVTVVLSTHCLEEVDDLASRLAVLDHGRVVALGSPDRLKREWCGDMLKVELAEPPSEVKIRSALSCVPGVRDIVVGRSGLTARVNMDLADPPSLLAALEAAGSRVASMTLTAPGIEDVYMRHACPGLPYNEETPGR
jgi:ABC-2 type transport system ATP-binding protein